MLHWFQGLATLDGFLYFLAGFAFAYLQHCLRMKFRHKQITIPWHLAGISIGVAAIVIVTVQSSVAYNTAEETAESQRLCNIQFRAALLERSKITTENDELSQDQRKIVFHWIHDLIFPPPPYASMTTNDPRRQDYGYQLTVNTERIFQASLDRQNVLQDERAKHPLPDPLCGE